ncbi:Deleted in malignant brain tumors 1 protein [Nibea albiflora]|nr:Deleted in malignant brain tumors 1 protein [Nibea albiflora]
MKMFHWFIGLLMAASSAQTTDAEARLVNGNSRCSGRVEILYNNEWGTVCDDNWDVYDAKVVCRQVGCGPAQSATSGGSFGPGTGQIWMDDVSCSGSESALSECRHRGFGTHNCGHGDDAGVICSDAEIRLVNGNSRCSGRVEILIDNQWGTVCDDGWDLTNAQVVCRQLGCGPTQSTTIGTTFGPAVEARLVNGNSRCSGRVEILYNNQWGTVCDDNWDVYDAKVVCRQAGCGPAQSATSGGSFGPGTGQIWMDDVSCSGSESALSECRHRGFGTHNCGHGDDAGVICSDAEIRLVNGNSRCSGRVEILIDNQWGTVCDDGWNLTNAQVVCRQLGCGPTQSTTIGTTFGPAVEARLVNGNSRCSGRVEILYNNQWGTVCDDNWDVYDAKVVCRQVGCGPAQSATSGGSFGPGTGQIWMDDVSCSGSESALSECRHRGFGTHNCGHGDDAGVICSDAEIRLVNGNSRCSGRVEILIDNQWGTVCDDGWDLTNAQVVCRQLGCGPTQSTTIGATFGPAVEARLVNGNSRCSGRVEILYNNQWGTVCDDNWDVYDAKVVCRQAGCGPAQSATSGGSFGPGTGQIWMDDVSCSGSESALSECRHRGFGTHNCGHGDDAGVICSDAEIRLVNGNSRCSGRVEILIDNQWGTVCDDGWDLTNAQVVCRQLGCGPTQSTTIGATFGPAVEARLVNGNSRCSGRVEILYNNEWGTVCDDNWDVYDAKVVCRQVGCGPAQSATSGGSFGPEDNAAQFSFIESELVCGQDHLRLAVQKRLLDERGLTPPPLT